MPSHPSISVVVKGSSPKHAFIFLCLYRGYRWGIAVKFRELIHTRLVDRFSYGEVGVCGMAVVANTRCHEDDKYGVASAAKACYELKSVMTRCL